MDIQNTAMGQGPDKPGETPLFLRDLWYVAALAEGFGPGVMRREMLLGEGGIYATMWARQQAQARKPANGETVGEAPRQPEPVMPSGGHHGR